MQLFEQDDEVDLSNTKKRKGEDDEESKKKKAKPIVLYQADITSQLDFVSFEEYTDEGDEYLLQVVHTHEIGKSLKRLLDVKSLVKEVENVSDHSRVFKVDDLDLVTLFFDIDIKQEKDSEWYDLFEEKFRTFLHNCIDIPHDVPTFYRRDESFGIHVIVPGYCIEPRALYMVIETMSCSRYFQTEFYTGVIFDPCIFYGLPGFKKPKCHACYKSIDENKLETFLFPKTNDKTVIINLQKLFDILRSGFEQKSKFKAMPMGSLYEISYNEILPWVCSLFGKEPFVVNEIYKYISNTGEEFKFLLFMLYVLKAKECNEADIETTVRREFTKLVDEHHWFFDCKFFETFDYDISDTEVSIMTKIKSIINLDELNEQMDQNSRTAIVHTRNVYNVCIPNSLYESILKASFHTASVDMFFSFIIFLISMKFSQYDFYVSKRFITQCIIFDEERFKFLISRLYAIQFKKEGIGEVGFKKMCKQLGWSYFNFNFLHKKHTFQTDETILEICYNLLCMNTFKSNRFDLTYTPPNSVTLTFNRGLIDRMCNVYSLGLNASQVNRYKTIIGKPQHPNILHFLYSIFPIRLDKANECVSFFNGHKISLNVDSLRTYIANIFIYLDFHNQKPEWWKGFEIKSSSIFVNVFKRNFRNLIVFENGKIRIGSETFRNSYSLVTSGVFNNIDYDKIDRLSLSSLDIKEEDIKTKDYTSDFPDNDTFYAFQYLFLLMSFNFDETKKLIAFLRAAISFKASRSIIVFLGVRGSNGKTKLTEILMKILGSYVTPISKQNFSGSSANHQNDIVRSAYGCISLIDEFDPNASADSQAIKTYTGAATIVAREIYKGTTTFTFEGCLLTTVNHLSAAPDEAMLNRVVVFEFNNQIRCCDEKYPLNLSKDAISKAGNAYIFISSNERTQNKLESGLINLIFGKFDMFNNVDWRDTNYNKHSSY